MFVEGGGGWKPRAWEPPPRKPHFSKRDEQIILWLIPLLAILTFVAPIGGATIIEAVISIFSGR